jgi:hypothetical protein
MAETILSAKPEPDLDHSHFDVGSKEPLVVVNLALVIRHLGLRAETINRDLDSFLLAYIPIPFGARNTGLTCSGQIRDCLGNRQR